MKELLILALIGAAGYFAYDDYYKQRPALQQAQAEIQQLRQNPVPPQISARTSSTYIPIPLTTPSTWFQKRLDEGSSLETSRQHTRQGEKASTPRP
jgi:hypothetical protein